MNNITWKYVKQIDNSNLVVEVMKVNNVVLPESYKSIVIENNGGRPSLNIFNSERKKERVFLKLLSYNKADKDTIYVALDVLNKKNNALYPFALDPFGNYICFNKRDMTIVFFDHETDQFEFIAKDFQSFMDMLFN